MNVIKVVEVPRVERPIKTQIPAGLASWVRNSKIRKLLTSAFGGARCHNEGSHWVALMELDGRIKISQYLHQDTPHSTHMARVVSSDKSREV